MSQAIGKKCCYGTKTIQEVHKYRIKIIINNGYQDE